MKNSSIIAIAIVCLLLGGAAGYLVTTTFLKPGGNIRSFNGANLGNGQGRTGARANGGMIAGELLKKDDGSLSIKLRDGSSKLVLTTSSTETLTMATGTLASLKVGENVIVNGTQNADGSLTANTVQTNPTGAMMQFGAMQNSQAGTQAGSKTTKQTTQTEGPRDFNGGPPPMF
ncbi:MAG: hypothetical protein WC750_00640 [Patescibacteria group bacterium]|jgi:hypothetical protein